MHACMTRIAHVKPRVLVYAGRENLSDVPRAKCSSVTGYGHEVQTENGQAHRQTDTRKPSSGKNMTYECKKDAVSPFRRGRAHAGRHAELLVACREEGGISGIQGKISKASWLPG